MRSSLQRLSLNLLACLSKAESSAMLSVHSMAQHQVIEAKAGLIEAEGMAPAEEIGAGIAGRLAGVFPLQTATGKPVAGMDKIGLGIHPQADMAQTD